MNNTIITIAVALIVGGAVGYAGAGYQYAAQLDKARNAFPATPSMEAISGTIQSISGNVITIQSQPSINPFENFPEMRTVTVTDTTVIVKSEVTDPEVFQREVEAYQAAMEESTADSSSSTMLPVPPMPTVETPADISKLAIGDLIVVEAGKDVKNVASFDAVRITFGWTAVTPAPVPAGANQGAAPMIDTPQVRTDGGTPPIVNTPPPDRQ